MNKQGENLNFDEKKRKVVYYRTRKINEAKPILRKIKDKDGNEIKQEYLQQLDERIYFKEEMVKNLDLEKVGSPGITVKDGHFIQTTNYMIHFWGRFLKGARLVYDVLKSHGNKKGYCYVSVTTISEMTGMSEPTVIKHLEVLEHYGFIYRLFCENVENGRQEASLYKIRLDTPLLTKELIDKLPKKLKQKHNEFLSSVHPVYRESILDKFDYESAYEELLTKGTVKKIYKELTEEEKQKVSKIRMQNIRNAQTVDDMKLWETVLDILRHKVSKPTLDTWFKDALCLIVGNIVEIYVEHEGIAEHLESRFKKLIEETVISIMSNIKFVTIKSV